MYTILTVDNRIRVQDEEELAELARHEAMPWLVLDQSTDVNQAFELIQYVAQIMFGAILVVPSREDSSENDG